jgi:hypothetical protein
MRPAARRNGFLSSGAPAERAGTFRHIRAQSGTFGGVFVGFDWLRFVASVRRGRIFVWHISKIGGTCAAAKFTTSWVIGVSGRREAAFPALASAPLGDGGFVFPNAEFGCMALRGVACGCMALHADWRSSAQAERPIDRELPR